MIVNHSNDTYTFPSLEKIQSKLANASTITIKIPQLINAIARNFADKCMNEEAMKTRLIDIFLKIQESTLFVTNAFKVNLIFESYSNVLKNLAVNARFSR